jgi:transposase
MAKRKAKSKPKQTRRKYTDEFKREAVKLVFEQELSVAEAARNLGIHANLLRNWKLRFEAENEGKSITEDERMEIARLRVENRRLRMERDILKKAAAFFANEKN